MKLQFFKSIAAHATGYVLIATMALMVSCSDKGGGSQPIDGGNDTLSSSTDDVPKIDDESVQKILKSLPNPLELTTQIKKIGAEYRKRDLNNTDNKSLYQSPFDQSLNLGIYSTDLGYANIFEKNQDVLQYLTVIKQLADELRIDKFFDYDEIKELAESGNNIDSLMMVTTRDFENINRHLSDKGRGYQSLLLLTGGWIEVVYLATTVYEKNNDKVLKESIAQQKVVIVEIMKIMKLNKSKPGFEELYAKLDKLSKIYDEVEVTVIQKEPIEIRHEDYVEVQDQSEQIFNISDETMKKLITQISEIRQSIIVPE